MTLALTVQAAQQGDARAFEQLVRQHMGVVCGLATAITRDPALGDEVGQQVFLTAWQKLRTLDNPASFPAWLRQLTRNRARDALRHQRVRPHALGEAAPEPADPLADVGTRLDAYRAEDALWQALDTLESDPREVLVLFYREGRSVKQVAQLLELGEPTVRKRLSRARAALREAVEAQLAEGLQATAPGAGFVAGVAALVAASAPGVAQAGTTTGLVAGAAKLAGAGAALGATAGLAGVGLGYRQAATGLGADDRVRLRRHALAQAAAIVVAAALMATVPGVVGTLAGMTLLVAVLGGTMARWPWSTGRAVGTLVGLGAGTLGASMGLAATGLPLATALALHLQLYAFVALPVVLVAGATWHLGVPARTAALGTTSWVAAVPGLALGPVLAAALLGPTPLAGAVGLALAAGLGEETARLVLFAALTRWRSAPTGREALGMGLGHGGLEAVLFGLGALAQLTQGPPLEAWAHALYGGSRALLLLGHVGFSLLVARSVRARGPQGWALAVAAHVALDLAAFAAPIVWPEGGMLVAGAAVVGWAAVSAWLVRDALR